MEVTGILKVKQDTQVVSEKFSKRELVLTTEGNTPYAQHVSFQVTQDKCSMLDQYNVGDELKVQFNLRGREWNGPQGIKYFNTLEVWRIEKVGEVKEVLFPEADPDKKAFSGSADNEDLPF